MTNDGMTNDDISLQDERDEMAFWGEEPGDAVMLLQDGPTDRVYDLEERTARFGEAIIRFAMKIPRNPVNDRHRQWTSKIRSPYLVERGPRTTSHFQRHLAPDDSGLTMLFVIQHSVIRHFL